jgi:TolB-like protein
MSSILPGYEYDIFISYRQKDNNLDGWVTEFVNTLKNEIDATFKEDISIYFDENLHDGLLETHDVDLSLSDKVKALIFIPIVSQTYCDPNGFAWQKEFLAFRDFAREDKLGLDIKLPNGNVAKRILPVRIHDIDQADQDLYEEEVGGVMRSIDFIYNSPGVNRSLRSVEEHPQDNLNKTIYRDQINKVANGIKELISSVKPPPGSIREFKSEQRPEDQTKSNKKFRLPVIIGLFLIALLLFIFKPWQSFTASDSLKLINKSIAVLPFKDLSPDQDKEYLGEGIAVEIINDLKTLPGLKVIGRTSSFSFRGKDVDLITIGKELGVHYLLEGSIQQEGSVMRVTANLIDSDNGSSIWTYTEDKKMTSILAIQNEIAGDLAEMFNETRNKERIIDVKPEVQDLYFLAKYYGLGYDLFTKDNTLKSINYYKQAIALDSGFSRAFSGLAYIYALSGFFGYDFTEDPWIDATENAKEGIRLDPNNSEAYFVLAYIKRTNDWDWEGARTLFKKSLSINPNSSQANYQYGLFLACINEADSGLYYVKKAFTLDPLDGNIQSMTLRLFNFSRRYQEGLIFLNNSVSSDKLKNSSMPWFLYKNKRYDQYINDLKSRESSKNAPFEVYGKSGIDAFHKAWFDRKEGGLSNFYWQASFGSLDDNFKLLNEEVEQKQGHIVYLLVNPSFDPLRADPRFDNLLRKMDLYKYK